jgi:hypothetical protein
MLLGLRRNVEQFYIAGMPKHISDPDNSMFYIISHEDEVYMFAKKTQKILRDRHIVLMNVKSHTTAFDHQGLETLSPPITGVNIDSKPSCCLYRFFHNSDIPQINACRGVLRSPNEFGRRS